MSEANVSPATIVYCLSFAVLVTVAPTHRIPGIGATASPSVAALTANQASSCRLVLPDPA